MAGPSRREELQPRIMISENIKASNEQILYIEQAIREAIKRPEDFLPLHKFKPSSLIRYNKLRKFE